MVTPNFYDDDEWGVTALPEKQLNQVEEAKERPLIEKIKEDLEVYKNYLLQSNKNKVSVE